MSALRSILAIYNNVDELPMLTAACELALKHQARLRCLHVSREPTTYAGIYGEGIVLSADVVTAIERENRTHCEEAKQQFMSLAEKFRLPVHRDEDNPPLRHPSACFVHRTGIMETIVAEEGRASDLILLHRMPTGNTSMAYEGALAAALFGSGRPLLLVPKKAAIPSLDDRTMAVAWNNSREAALALKGALPFLLRAEKIYLLVARSRSDTLNPAADQNILNYLALHGITATIHAVDKKSDDVGDVLLQKAAALNAGMLVMGAYGHSRFREIVLGGVTEYVLRYSDIPVLMAH